MAEIDRPEWCPCKSCQCLYSICERTCFGRLPRKVPHDADGRDPEGIEELFNTHRLCEDGEEAKVFNAEDAVEYGHGYKVVLEDCEANPSIYMPPGRGVSWDLRQEDKAS